MTTMIAEVYDALIEAGASEEKARKAAEAIAGYDDRFNRIELRLGGIDGRLRLMQWQLGAIWAVMTVVGIPSVWLLLRIAAKVGALG
jgi:hypothetical protein